MKTTLIQCASGRFVDLQLKTAPHHAAYCRKHGYNYLLYIGEVQSKFGPMWDKIDLVRFALEQSTFVVWMDSDSLIVDTSVPLTHCMKEFRHIGACTHPELWGAMPHFNCGVMFFLQHYKTQEFLKAVKHIGHIPHESWQVQATILTVNDSMKLIWDIDDRWNSTIGTNVSPNPVIESWHGHNQDFTPILRRLEEVRLA